MSNLGVRSVGISAQPRCGLVMSSQLSQTYLEQWASPLPVPVSNKGAPVPGP